jgi:hypothetical protein
MKTITLFALGSVLAGVLHAANPPAPAGPRPRLPVKEVTVFKDGHAFVLHEGRLPTAGSDVVMDYLPAPVIGTFWAYSADPATRLAGWWQASGGPPSSARP